MSNRDDDFDDEEIDANGEWIGVALFIAIVFLAALGIAMVVF